MKPVNLKISTIIVVMLCALSASAVQHHLDSTLSETYQSGRWNKQFRTNYHWDLQCKKELSEIFFHSNSTSSVPNWYSYKGTFYSYDSLGRQVVADYRDVNLVSPISKDSFIYVGNTNAVSILLRQSWNNSLNSYQDNERYIYHYFTPNVFDTIFTDKWDTSTTTWIPLTRWVIQHDAVGHDTAKFVQYFDTFSRTYYATIKYVIDYNAVGQVTSSTRYLQNSGSWAPDTRDVYAIDISGFVIQCITDNWDAGTNAWVNYSKLDMTNNADGEIVSSIYSIGSGTNWSPQTRYRYYYGCSINTGIEQEANTEVVKLYPNPTTNVLELYLPYLIGTAQLSVINKQGQIVRQEEVVRGINSIHLEYLSAGMYMLQWNNNGHIETRKFIKE
jgi:hypothetical protein